MGYDNTIPFMITVVIAIVTLGATLHQFRRIIK
jgi:hypothetical protein